MVEPALSELIGQRLNLQNKLGSIRYVGKLQNNPKAGDSIWLGIEWDEPGNGKHNGTVDGVKYFETEFVDPESEEAKTSCSFLRHGKVQIGGISFMEAIKEKYQPDNLLTDAEKYKLFEEQKQQLYVMTGNKGSKAIELMGFDQSYSWRSDVSKNYEIALEQMKISDLGPPGQIRSLVPSCMQLQLDKNLLYSWDQFFHITSELPYLSTLVLSGNRFRKIDKTYFDGKNIDQMVNLHLTELVLIDMPIDWSQIDILAPTLLYIEQLHLVRTKCSHISSKYTIAKEYFKNLKFLNVEQNNIQSWDELQGFKNCPSLRRITISKNPIKKIDFKTGFNDVYMITMEDCAFPDFSVFDTLNEFKGITHVRCHGNPAFDSIGEQDGRSNVIARIEFIKKLNGSDVSESERKDAEISYLRKSYLEFLKENKIEGRLENIDDERLQLYMTGFHPRWYTLVEKYGSPLENTQLGSEKTNIAQSSARVNLVSKVEASEGKVLEKKLLLSMTVNNLKAMAAKLFKIEVLHQRLMYKDVEGMEYELEEDYRLLDFYGVRDGSEIWVEDKSK